MLWSGPRLGVVGSAVAAALKAGITTSERERRYKRLREQCRRVIGDVIAPHLVESLEAISKRGRERVITESIASDRDPFVVRVEYPGSGLTPPDDYFQPSVKIELSGRAEDAPAESREIVPYVREVFTELFEDETTPISCILRQRTFWEKAGLPLESAANLLNDPEYALVFGKT